MGAMGVCVCVSGTLVVCSPALCPWAMSWWPCAHVSVFRSLCPEVSLCLGCICVLVSLSAPAHVSLPTGTPAHCSRLCPRHCVLKCTWGLCSWAHVPVCVSPGAPARVPGSLSLPPLTCCVPAVAPTSWLLQGWSCGALPAAAPVPQFPCVPSPHGGVLTPAASHPGDTAAHPKLPGEGDVTAGRRAREAAASLSLSPPGAAISPGVPRETPLVLPAIQRGEALPGGARGVPIPAGVCLPPPPPNPPRRDPPEMDSIIMDTKHQEGRKGARGERSGEAEASGWMGAGGGIRWDGGGPKPPPPHTFWG